MWLNTNRLNLNNMVEKHINVPLVTPSQKDLAPLYVKRRGNATDENQVYENLKASASDIQFSVNTIMAQVHNTVKTRVMKPPKSKTAIPLPAPPVVQPEASQPTEKKEPSVVEVIPAKPSNFAKQQQSTNKPATPKKKTNSMKCISKSSIPQVKAKWQQKCQFKMRRNIGPGESHYANQLRINEILRQKKILVEMLDEHERLQRDRQSIAREINVMRTYLNEIRSKLDFSIRKLQQQPTICDHYSKYSIPSIKPKVQNVRKVVPLKKNTSSKK